MHRLRWLLLAAVFLGTAAPSLVSASWPPGTKDPLSARDEWGRLHQSKWIDETDFAKREWWRLFYYSKSRYVLMKDPAYVGALQSALQRNGYYCGQIDGIYSENVTEAIAQLQKNHHMRVTGNLTIPVRRSLRLP